ncbi:MAG: hypothetical protein ACXV8O_05045 [Methylobacter sp.]
MTNTATSPTRQLFYYSSCQLERPTEQLGKIIKGNRSKRCKFCCDKADAAKAQLAKGIGA